MEFINFERFIDIIYCTWHQGHVIWILKKKKKCDKKIGTTYALPNLLPRFDEYLKSFEKNNPNPNAYAKKLILEKIGNINAALTNGVVCLWTEFS